MNVFFSWLLIIFSTLMGGKFIMFISQEVQCFEKLKSYEKKLKICGRFLAYKKNLEFSQKWLSQEGIFFTSEEKEYFSEHISSVEPEQCSKMPILLHMQPSHYGSHWPNWVFYVQLTQDHDHFFSHFLDFSFQKKSCYL